MRWSGVIIIVLIMVIGILSAYLVNLNGENEFLKGEISSLEIIKRDYWQRYIKASLDYKDVLTENRELRQTFGRWKEIKNVKLTAYCPCTECSGKWGKKTKLGTTAKEGRTIAVDPDVIPLGSAVLIEGKVYIAEDIGGAVKGNHIDIYFDEHKDDFRKYVEVIVLN